MHEKNGRKPGVPSGSGPLYFLGMIGALVFYVQRADGFWPVVTGVLKAFVWPGFLVYDLLRFISK